MRQPAGTSTSHADSRVGRLCHVVENHVLRPACSTSWPYSADLVQMARGKLQIPCHAVLPIVCLAPHAFCHAASPVLPRMRIVDDDCRILRRQSWQAGIGRILPSLRPSIHTPARAAMPPLQIADARCEDHHVRPYVQGSAARSPSRAQSPRRSSGHLAPPPLDRHGEAGHGRGRGGRNTDDKGKTKSVS